MDRAIFRDRRILLLVSMIVFAIMLVAVKGFHLGLEFQGGVRIPIHLEAPIDGATMEDTINTLKQRINAFGMSQVVVKPLGNQDIIIEVPKSSEDAVKQVEKVLSEEGKFYAVIGGEIAFTGDEVTGIDRTNSRYNRASNEWVVSFGVTEKAAQKFAELAIGRANEPVYMFLDRPDYGIIAIKSSILPPKAPMDEMQKVLELGDKTIPLIVYEDINDLSKQISEYKGKKKIILWEDENIGKTFNGLEVEKVPRTKLVPRVRTTGIKTTIDRWDAAGLMSAPVLSPSLVQEFEAGRILYNFQISGGTGTTNAKDGEQAAKEQIRFLETILMSGRLPVALQIGSVYYISPLLGEQFLQYSIAGFVFALVAVAFMIYLKYKKIKLVLPVLGTGIIELSILIALVGSIGTVDLSAFAGIIAAVGGGVDDQLIITDEVIFRKRKQEKTGESIKRAFAVIMSDAASVIFAMIPLLLSGLVEIVGFAISSIIGTALGVLVVRPAYGAILEHMFK